MIRERSERGTYLSREVDDWYERDLETGCWEWLGRIDNKGYGRFRGPRGWGGAHRWMYQQKVGPIPPGLVIDHLCRNRKCVNPDHLEPVTRGENTKRGLAAKITFEDALRIRSEMDRICEQYDLGPRMLAVIAERRSWKEG